MLIPITGLWRAARLGGAALGRPAHVPHDADELARSGAGEEGVHRALNSGGAAVEGMSIDHRGRDVPGAQEFLDGADVVPGFEEMSREGMAEGMWAGTLCDGCPRDGFLDGAPQERLVQMMAPVV